MKIIPLEESISMPQNKKKLTQKLYPIGKSKKLHLIIDCSFFNSPPLEELGEAFMHYK